MGPIWQIILISLAIFFARIADVTLGTIRTVMVVQGRRAVAWLLSFFEVLIWVLAISQVMQHLDENPIYAVMFALGAATGNFLGITMEARLGLGRQIVRVFTRQGEEVAAALRVAGYRVTQIEGQGRDGPVDLLFAEVRRRTVGRVAQIARETDPGCYYIVDDVRMASAQPTLVPATGWRAIFKRK